MRGRLRKLFYIVGTAIVTGIFLQFSVHEKGVHEVVFTSKKQLPPYLIQDSTSWSDSVYSTLSLKDKVAQMMMVAAYPNHGEADKNRVTKLIKDYKVGGIIFFQGTAKDVAELSNYYQSISEVPLIMAIDGEWGASMRLKNTIKYPKQMMLGAITDEMLIYQMGKDIAQQLKQIGIHVNFAPVVDVNNNPKNPVINTRSFGEQRVNVARKGLLYMKGMQDAGVLAFAKHFPGHGDTETDSHFGLPVIKHSRGRLDSLELYPFRALINAGVGGVMIAHMNVLSLDSTPNLPSTLSPLIVDTLLQKELGFKGLVVTDAMGMQGVAKLYKPVDANMNAVMAGNDIILMPDEVEQSIKEITKAVEDGSINVRSIENSCQKIIKAKEWVVKNNTHATYSPNEMVTPEFLANKQKLIESAITIVENKKDLLPLQRLDTLKIAHVILGPNSGKDFNSSLKLYAAVEEISIDTRLSLSEQSRALHELKNYNLIVASLHSSSINAVKKFNVREADIQLLNYILEQYPTILVDFTNPYVLKRIESLNDALAITVAYENDSVTQKTASEIIFGAKGATGKLPVSISPDFMAGTGITTRVLDRFVYTSPYEAGFDEEKLEVIDSIVADAINEKAMPGCQILAAKDGKVFFSKNYGYHTYKKIFPVKSDDIYDLASLTKVSATLPIIMKMHADKIIDIDKPLKNYLTGLDTSAKGNLIISDILKHQAGLKSWIPFYWNLLEPIYPNQDLLNRRYSERYPIKLGPGAYVNKHINYVEECLAHEKSEKYPFQIAEALYLRKDFADSIWIKILQSELEEPGNYRYSDLGYYLFNLMIQEQLGNTLDNYIDSLFYRKMGAYTLSFRPLERFEKNRIIPTENDLVFRRQLVHGFVHDPGAAMLGGVCGHAGLFGSANDLAKIFQLYLNNGKYGGDRYLSRKHIQRYTSNESYEEFENRRGIGFDKPQPDTTKSGPAFNGISVKSYGHTGFTGTMAWADPDTGILYVFLSNRIFPDASNTKLIKMDVRTKIQQAIYDAMLEEAD